MYVGHGLTNRGVLSETVPGYRNGRSYCHYYRSKHGVKQVGWLLDFHVPSTVWAHIGTGKKDCFLYFILFLMSIYISNVQKPLFLYTHAG